MANTVLNIPTHNRTVKDLADCEQLTPIEVGQQNFD